MHTPAFAVITLVFARSSNSSQQQTRLTLTGVYCLTLLYSSLPTVPLWWNIRGPIFRFYITVITHSFLTDYLMTRVVVSAIKNTPTLIYHVYSISVMGYIVSSIYQSSWLAKCRQACSLCSGGSLVMFVDNASDGFDVVLIFPLICIAGFWEWRWTANKSEVSLLKV